jgi:hypothetical protein
MSQYGPPERDAVDIDALIARLEAEYTQVWEFTRAAAAPADTCARDDQMTATR